MSRWRTVTLAKHLCCLLLMPGLTACAPDTRRFVPEGVDVAQTAHLIALTDPMGKDAPPDGHFQVIVWVDGKPSKSEWGVSRMPSDLYLVPGTHRFTVESWHAGLSASGGFEVDLKAGVSYFVHRHSSAYGVKFWITEGTQDGPKVGKPIPPFQ